MSILRTSVHAPALALAVALLASSSGVRADGADDTRPATDLIDVLRATPIARPLDRARIRPYGWVEASVTTSPLTEESRAPAGSSTRRSTASASIRPILLERAPADGCCLDLGGKVAVLWGHGRGAGPRAGLLDDQTGDEHFDLLEAHALVRLPLACGLTLKVGKFTTPMGFEVIEAANNLLPSRSFLFGYAIPFTHTGVLATVQATPTLSLSWGVVLGWDVWDDDNPHALTQLASFGWKAPDERDAITLNAIVGAERPGNTSDLRMVFDATWTHTWSDRWKSTINADVGYEEGAAAGQDASWWGVAGYAPTPSAIASQRPRVPSTSATGRHAPAPGDAGELTRARLDPWCRLPISASVPSALTTFDGPFDCGRRRPPPSRWTRLHLLIRWHFCRFRLPAGPPLWRPVSAPLRPISTMRAFCIDLLLATALLVAAVLLRGPRFDAGGSWQLAVDAANPPGVVSATLHLDPNGHYDLGVERTDLPVRRSRGTWFALPHGFELQPLPSGMTRIPGSRAALVARAEEGGTVVLEVEVALYPACTPGTTHGARRASLSSGPVSCAAPAVRRAPLAPETTWLSFRWPSGRRSLEAAMDDLIYLGIGIALFTSRMARVPWLTAPRRP
jgi:hypothetical protein